MNFQKCLHKAKELKTLTAGLLIGVVALVLEIRITKRWDSIFYLSPFLGILLHFLYQKKKEKQRIVFYEQLQEFIGNLQMYYGYFGEMGEALYEAAVNSKEKAFLLGKWMQKELRNFESGKTKELWNDTEEIRGATLDAEQISYVKMLLLIAKSGVLREGKEIAIEESLRRMKEEVREKSMQYRAIREEYTGLIEILLLSAYAVPFALAWGTSNLEELGQYYNSVTGRIFTFICLLTTILLYFLLTKLRFQNGLLSYVKQEGELAEILRIYNWILLQRENDNCCIEGILEGILPILNRLRGKMERLYYDYMQFGLLAVEQLRDREMSVPVAGVLEGIIRCDQVNISKAFDGIENEREYYLEQFREIRKKTVRDSAALGKVLAFIPMYAVILLLLVIPFVYQGLNMMNDFGNRIG